VGHTDARQWSHACAHIDVAITHCKREQRREKAAKAPRDSGSSAWPLCLSLLAPGGVVVLTRGCVQDNTPSAPSCTPTPASRATDQGTWGTPARFVARQARRACAWLKPTSARAWVKNSRLFSLDMVQAWTRWRSAQIRSAQITSFDLNVPHLCATSAICNQHKKGARGAGEGVRGENE
jgi:hypothetical protein